MAPAQQRRVLASEVVALLRELRGLGLLRGVAALAPLLDGGELLGDPLVPRGGVGIVLRRGNMRDLRLLGHARHEVALAARRGRDALAEVVGLGLQLGGELLLGPLARFDLAQLGPRGRHPRIQPGRLLDRLGVGVVAGVLVGVGLVLVGVGLVLVG